MHYMDMPQSIETVPTGERVASLQNSATTSQYINSSMSEIHR